MPRIPGHLKRGAPVPQLRVHAGLEFLEMLGRDIRRAGRPLDHRAGTATDDGGRERRKLLAEQGLVSRLAVSAPHLELRALPHQVREPLASPSLGIYAL